MTLDGFEENLVGDYIKAWTQYIHTLEPYYNTVFWRHFKNCLRLRFCYNEFFSDRELNLGFMYRTMLCKNSWYNEASYILKSLMYHTIKYKCNLIIPSLWSWEVHFETVQALRSISTVVLPLCLIKLTGWQFWLMAWFIYWCFLHWTLCHRTFWTKFGIDLNRVISELHYNEPCVWQSVVRQLCLLSQA